MMSGTTYLYSLLAMAIFAIAGWLLSLLRHNVTHVDSMWSLFFLIGALTTWLQSIHHNARASILLALVALWALRLCVYLTWRNWGPHEDHRYATIRQNNQPGFWLKSLYIVFGLQVALAWIISAPLCFAIQSAKPLTPLDGLGCALVIAGLLWESIADWQLAAFKAKPANRGNVLSSGLWRYSRHPNYFGECCVWWGFYLIAWTAGGWWTLFSPILMTLLLLKVSGVSLLESTIQERRPAYRQYMQSTNAFFPGLPKKPDGDH